MAPGGDRGERSRGRRRPGGGSRCPRRLRSGPVPRPRRLGAPRVPRSPPDSPEAAGSCPDPRPPPGSRLRPLAWGGHLGRAAGRDRRRGLLPLSERLVDFILFFFPGETSLRSGGPVTSHQPQPGRNRWRVNFGGEGTASVCSGKGDVTEKGFNPRVPHSPPGLPQPAEQILDKSCPLPRSCPGRWGHPHSGDSPRPQWWHAVAQEPCPCRGVWVAPPAPVTASGIQLQPYPKQQGPGDVVWAWAVTRGGHGHGCGMAVGMDMVWVWVWVRVWMCHQEQVTLVTLPEVPSHQDARRVAER